MGMCLDPTPEMGEYSVEVRRESFHIRGEDRYDNPDLIHTFHLNPSPVNANVGDVEVLIEDLPKLRAALDQVEGYLNGRSEPEAIYSPKPGEMDEALYTLLSEFSLKLHRYERDSEIDIPASVDRVWSRLTMIIQSENDLRERNER